MSKDYSKYINRPGYQVPAGYDPSKYPGQSATADIVILSFFNGRLQALLIRRKKMPFQGYWAIPGGFVEMEEDLPEAAARELFEETGIKNLQLIEFGAFGHPHRDPRTRTITIAYLALARKDQVQPRAGDDAEDYAWFPARNPPELAFDHQLVLQGALSRLQELSLLTPALFEILPKAFSSAELQELSQEIFQKRSDEKWLVKKMRGQKLIKSAGQMKFKFAPGNFFPGSLSFLIAKKV